MFTGIIQSLANVAKTQKVAAGLKLAINLGNLAKKIAPADSVAVNGVCLTATKRENKLVYFDVVNETVKRTNLGKLKTGEVVNIELAIKSGEPFGGHFVQGHIDGTGVISRKSKIGQGYLMEITASPSLTGQMIEKGSVAIDGVSLTIARLKRDRFSVALIPYTLAHTTLGKKTAGSVVNLETDILGKWVNKSLHPQDSKTPYSPSPNLKELL